MNLSDKELDIVFAAAQCAGRFVMQKELAHIVGMPRRAACTHIHALRGKGVLAVEVVGRRAKYAVAPGVPIRAPLPPQPKAVATEAKRVADPFAHLAADFFEDDPRATRPEPRLRMLPAINRTLGGVSM